MLGWFEFKQEVKEKTEQWDQVRRKRGKRTPVGGNWGFKYSQAGRKGKGMAKISHFPGNYLFVKNDLEKEGNNNEKKGNDKPKGSYPKSSPNDFRGKIWKPPSKLSPLIFKTSSRT